MSSQEHFYVVAGVHPPNLGGLRPAHAGQICDCKEVRVSISTSDRQGGRARARGGPARTNRRCPHCRAAEERSGAFGWLCGWCPAATNQWMVSAWVACPRQRVSAIRVSKHRGAYLIEDVPAECGAVPRFLVPLPIPSHELRCLRCRNSGCQDVFTANEHTGQPPSRAYQTCPGSRRLRCGLASPYRAACGSEMVTHQPSTSIW